MVEKALKEKRKAGLTVIPAEKIKRRERKHAKPAEEVLAKKDLSTHLAGQHLEHAVREEEENLGVKNQQEVKNNENTKRAANTDYKRRVE